MISPFSSSSSCRQSTLLLISLFLATLQTLPTVRGQTFNETDCLSCVRSDEINGFTSHYCEVDAGTFQCISTNDEQAYATLCPNSTSGNYSKNMIFEWECTGDFDDVVKTVKGIAIGVLVFTICCSVAVLASIIACIVCCIRSSNNRGHDNNNNNNNNTVPQQYHHQQHQHQHKQVAVAAGSPHMLVLPGKLETTTNQTGATMMMMTTTPASHAAHTGLVDAVVESPYQPSYQYDNTTNNIKV